MTSSASWATAASSSGPRTIRSAPLWSRCSIALTDLRRALVGAEGEDPGHRQVGEADGQREQRCGGPAVSPLQVVERDQERPVEGGALEQHLEVLQQPVALLGQRAKLRQRRSLEQRVRAVEQRGHQRRELDDPRAGLSRARAHPEREPPRDPDRLGQEASFAHTRLSLDEHHRPDTRAHAIKLNTDRREFSVPTANNGSAGGRQAQIRESTSLAEARFAVTRLRASGAHICGRAVGNDVCRDRGAGRRVLHRRLKSATLLWERPRGIPRSCDLSRPGAWPPSPWKTSHDHAIPDADRDETIQRMPMIDVYAAVGTFSDKDQLAQELASAVMRWEAVPEIPLFADNTAAFIHDLPAEAISNVAGRRRLRARAGAHAGRRS